MLFQPTELAGLVLIVPQPFEDDRGLFARTFCRREFEAQGLPGTFVQCNTSFNVKRGTLRGMHFQTAPHEEPKLVRCTQGTIYDVIVDIRRDSATFCRWQGFELSAANRKALYVPPGFAHGFQTLTDGAEVFYQMGEYYDAASASGVRWDDPAFNIAWPIASPTLSPRDRTYPDVQR